MSDGVGQAPAAPRIMQRSVPAVFIHSAPRTSSTWFWTKFRELPSTLCFYEPFSFTINWLNAARAGRMNGTAWPSRHPRTEPYYQEYIPLLRTTGGVELFDLAMTIQWFIPQGGLRGELRPSEKDYLANLIRHAEEAGKVPVFGDCWSLGRCWAIRNAVGGFNIFQYRNLWRQWISYLSFKQNGDMTFYAALVDTLFRDDDPYLSYLVERGLKRAEESLQGVEHANAPPKWRRMYVNGPRDENKVRQIELMPEHLAFELFMGLHLYLYLHAELSTDLAVDITRMARDDVYRADIERAVERQTGLPVSFADVGDTERPDGVKVDVEAIDWDEIRDHGRAAVRALSGLGDAERLAARAAAFIDATIDEMRRAEAQPAAAPSSPTPPQDAAPVTVDAITVEAATVQTPAPAAREGHETAIERRGSGMATIGLNMIVKNESRVIRQCLTSALPLVDYILVVDTGSEDGTQQIIRDFLAEHGVPGKVVEEPWENFAYNRTFALDRLREVEEVDYALIIDADDLVVLDEGFDPAAFKARLDKDLYDIDIFHGDIVFNRPQILRNRLPFKWKGVLHEYVEAPPGRLSRDTARGFRIRTSRGGARSQNPRKYQEDAALLERTLATETDPFLISRYRFYLAQSYKDCGEREKALENYLKRAELGYWSEEIFIALLEAGNLMAALDRPFDEVIATYERAAGYSPGRAEAFFAASHYCRMQGRNAEGQEIARRGIDLPLPPGGLFVQRWVYDYGILDEFAINAYWAGAYRESLDASLRLLASDKLPPSMVARIAANARFAANKMPAAKPPELGTFAAESMIAQHALVAPRSLRSRIDGAPRVLVAILAKQKAPSLPLYLQCIEALDYPKSSIVLHIRTNNNTDQTEQILREWVERVGHLYAGVELDAADVADRVEEFGEHEWNATRFRVLARIRNTSLRRTLDHRCDYYFVADVDNFVRPATLRELVALNLPIVAPLLRSILPERFYANYHADVDAAGYYRHCDQYHWILNRNVRGIIEMPVVHCTYLIRADVIPQLSYEDETSRHEYVVFSDNARKAGIPQYLDNRQVYGYITFGEGEWHVSDGTERARALLRGASPG